MLPKAAQANSVRKADEQFGDVGEAGLSLRDITYNRTHASRASEKAVIKVEIWYKINTRSVIAGTAHSLPTVALSI